MTLTREHPVAPALPPTVTDDPRIRLRRWLYLAGIVPVAVALAFTLKVVVVGHHDRAGRTAWGLDDAPTAMEQWRANRSLNLLQSWIAPFDTGDAAFRMHDWGHAISDYRTALKDVPQKDECTVRINLSLTQEAVGDGAEAQGRHDDARKSWSDALGTLRAGDCPTRSGRGEQQTKQSQSEQQRLQQKLEDKPPQQPQPQQKKQQGSSGEEDKKSKQLDKNNDDGQSVRKGYQDRNDYGKFGDQPQW